MTKRKNVLYLMFTLLIIFPSCKDDNEESPLQNPSDQQKENPNDTSKDLIKLTHFMSGEFYTDTYGNGTNFISMLLSDGIEWDNKEQNFTGKGQYMLLEINSKLISDYMPDLATYSVRPEIGSLVNTFEPGILECNEGICYASSTYYAEVDEDGNEIYTILTDGTLAISKKENGEYLIDMNLKDEDGNPFKAIYEGNLPLIFIGYKYEPQEDSNVKLNLKNVSRAECWKDFYRNNTSDMLIDFETEDGKQGIGLEFFCPSTDRESITPGVYDISTENKEMTVKPGYFDGYGTLRPSYAFLLGNSGYEKLWWFSSGTITVNRNEEIYSISIKATSAFGSQIEGYYEGPLPIIISEYATGKSIKRKITEKFRTKQ